MGSLCPPCPLLSPGSTVAVLAVGFSRPDHFGAVHQRFGAFSPVPAWCDHSERQRRDRNVSPTWLAPGGGGLWSFHIPSPTLSPQFFLAGSILHSPRFSRWSPFPPQTRLLVPSRLWLSPAGCGCPQAVAVPCHVASGWEGFSPPPCRGVSRNRRRSFGFQTSERLS